MKQCTNSECLNWFPATLEFFYKQKESKDSLSSWCKVCKIKYQKIYAEKNREDVLFSKRRYRNANKDKINERASIWIRDNLEKWKDYYRSWQQSESGKISMKKNNLFREMNKKHEITPKEWKECKEFFNYECAYCGLPEEEHRKFYKQQLHRDHYYHHGSNKIDNCVPSCRVCNSEKHDKEVELWYSKIHPFYSKIRKTKIVKWLDKFQ